MLIDYLQVFKEHSKEGEIPTHIQLQLKEGSTVNLYMCRPNGHARVRWQTGRVRTKTEGGTQIERFTGTDGRDPVEQLKKWMHTYQERLTGATKTYIESMISRAEAGQRGGTPARRRPSTKG